MISVVLPAYKAKFLKTALDSVLNQSYSDFELIVVDDCSPDDIKSIVDEVADDRVKYYRNEINIGGRNGLVSAWNHAISYASGEWLVLASDDDVYGPEFLEEMVRLRDRYPEVRAVHCRMVATSEDGAWRWAGCGRPEIESQIEMAHSLVIRDCQQRVSDFMYHRQTLLDNGGFVDFPLGWYADGATAITMSKFGVACSPKILFEWRCSDINISLKTDNLVQKMEAIEAYKKWLKDKLNDFKPSNKLDELLLVQLKSKAAETFWGPIYHFLDQMSLVEWCRCVWKFPYSRNRKLRLIKARLKKAFKL